MRITECWLYLYITKQHRLYLEQWAGGISDGPHCHNNGHGPHYHNGLLEYPLLAADLHQPYRLEQWAAGISDGPHCHNNGLGPQVTPMVLIARLFTLLALSPHYSPLGLTILSPHSECGCAASCISTSLCAATVAAHKKRVYE